MLPVSSVEFAIIIGVWSIAIIGHLYLCTNRIIKAIEQLRKDTP